MLHTDSSQGSSAIHIKKVFEPTVTTFDRGGIFEIVADSWREDFFPQALLACGADWEGGRRETRRAGSH